MICDKLELKAGDRLLDIGCGWGGFAKYAASTRGCEVTGISLSDEQIRFATDYTRGLPVTIRKLDYRDLPDSGLPPFDKVSIIGMIEHVGYKNYAGLMDVVHQMMKPDGLFPAAHDRQLREDDGRRSLDREVHLQRTRWCRR